MFIIIKRNSLNHFISYLGTIGLIKIILSLKGLILLPILTKNLTISDYGLYSLITITLTLLMPFVSLGLPSAILRFFSGNSNKNNIKNCFFLMLILTSLSILIFSSTFLVIANQIELSSVLIAILLLYILLESLNQLILVLLNAIDKIKKYSIINIFQITIELILISYLVIMGYGIIGAMTPLLISRLVTVLYGFYFISNEIGFPILTIKNIKQITNIKNVKPLLVFSLPLIPTAIFEWIINSSDRYLIQYFIGIDSVGIYSAAYTIGWIISGFVFPVAYVLYLTSAKAFNKSSLDECKLYFSYSLKIVSMILIPLYFGISVFSGQILTVLTSQEYAVNGSAIIPIIGMSAIFFGFYAIFEKAIILIKRTHYLTLFFLIAGIGNIIFNIIFIPIWGILGSSISTLFSYLILLIFAFYISYKNFKFDLPIFFIFKCTFSSLILISILYIININIAIPNLFFKLILLSLFGMMLYLMLLFITNTLNKNNIKMILNLMKI